HPVPRGGEAAPQAELPALRHREAGEAAELEQALGEGRAVEPDRGQAREQPAVDLHARAGLLREHRQQPLEQGVEVDSLGAEVGAPAHRDEGGHRVAHAEQRGLDERGRVAAPAAELG
ncbi:MAG: hypothetical protein ACK559_25285, partial [bacterium]